LLVFGVIAAVAFVQWVFGFAVMLADAALLAALYTVAAHRTWRQTLVAAAVVEFGIVLACLRWPQPGLLHGGVALSILAVLAVVVGVNVRTRRAYLASLRDRAMRLERERNQQARLAVADERSRIARDMHDIVSHNLSVMVALADAAVFTQHHNPDKTSAALRQISGTGRDALTDMRRFLGLLRDDEPEALRHPMPGLAQLASLAEQVRTAGVAVRLDVAGDRAELPAVAGLTVYRIVQEALTNTLKHAPAGSTAEVRVRCATDAVVVSVTDDGPPVAQPPSTTSGHGIHGMRERVAAYGGELQAGPVGPGGRWRVAARLDLTGVRA